MALVSLSLSLPCAGSGAAPASSLPLRAELNAPSSSLRPLASSSSSPRGRGRALGGGAGGGLALAAAQPAGASCSGRRGERWRVGVSSFSFLPSFFAGNKEKEDREKAERLKEEFLAAIKPLDRGADATPEDKERVEKIVQQLEEVNPVKEPLKSDLLNGKWELLYTTSESILQPKRPKFLRPFGTIYQSINTDTLRAQNMETWPYFNQVTANLVPLNSRRVAVKFDYFKIFSLIPIKAPGSGKGELEITYLDEELRASRGDKGNLFILKMVDPTYRVPLS
ncbi:probable plastid-lipid-associated protein 4, chloroplastic [Oryza brachyantha]|uniref:probable plastid-lipid-associated protein 4, chloroplastic n=1 Tax=Oryza brachyantha TaxID=4533 RepID=UPI0007769C0C|nr:probable plastid-lipid-associated protein 4, chloroplastic [Oryza brachyantha]